MSAQSTARVQVTLEFTCSAWGDDCTVGQVFKQAADDALLQLHRIQSHKCPGDAPLARFQIVGEPKVLAVIVPKEPT